MRNRLIKIFLLAFMCLFISCNTLKQPDSVPEPLDYSNEEIVKNEIKTINEFLETEPVRALWRSIMLGREDVINNEII